jgi:hypothetical protein
VWRMSSSSRPSVVSTATSSTCTVAKLTGLTILDHRC